MSHPVLSRVVQGSIWAAVAVWVDKIFTPHPTPRPNPEFIPAQYGSYCVRPTQAQAVDCITHYFGCSTVPTNQPTTAMGMMAWHWSAMGLPARMSNPGCNVSGTA